MEARTFRFRLLASGVLALGGMLVGCAGDKVVVDDWGSEPGRVARPLGGSPLVFASPTLAEASDDLEFERFEFRRNDDRVNVVTPTALRAVNQWPQPVRPAERPVRFSDWQQR